jgi:hypothetical protein
MTVHTYDEKTAIEVLEKIKHSYFPALQKFSEWA